MSDPQYTVNRGVIFCGAHRPMTLRLVTIAASIHRMNAAYQLAQTDERTLSARLVLAKVETDLAAELDAAINEITNQREAA